MSAEERALAGAGSVGSCTRLIPPFR